MDLRDGIAELMEGGSEVQLWQCNRVSGPEQRETNSKGFHERKTPHLPAEPTLQKMPLASKCSL